MLLNPKWTQLLMLLSNGKFNIQIRITIQASAIEADFDPFELKFNPLRVPTFVPIVANNPLISRHNSLNIYQDLVDKGLTYCLALFNKPLFQF